MPQVEARAEAIRRARAALAAELASGLESLEERCARLGLTSLSSSVLEFPLFGTLARLDTATLALSDGGGAPRSQAEEILFLHYLSQPGKIEAGGELISFRDLTGGAFYWEPFRSRTCVPLIRRYGADLAGLKAALDRFDWSERKLGDFGARIHGMGNLYLSLAFYEAEEGMESEILVLFDPAIKRVFQAEDAAAFASRICLGLL